MENNKATLLLGTQPIGRLLMQYAIPAIIAMTASSLYNMIDSIKNVPIYRTWTNVLTLLGTGFQVIGPVEIGEYWSIFSRPSFT